MRNIRCNKCGNVIAKEENDRIILRTGFGKTRVFHSFIKESAVLTCWFCKEIRMMEEIKNAKSGIVPESGNLDPESVIR